MPEPGCAADRDEVRNAAGGYLGICPVDAMFGPGVPGFSMIARPWRAVARIKTPVVLIQAGRRRIDQ